MHENEKDLIDGEDAPTNRWEDEENAYVNDYFAELEAEEPMDEETKMEQIPGLKRKWITEKICSEEFKNAVLDFKNFYVIKYTRFF